MIAELCYYYGYTPNEVLHLTWPQFRMLREQLPDLIEHDNRGAV